MLALIREERMLTSGRSEFQRNLRRTAARAGKWTGSRISIGLHRILGSRADGRFGILMYHRVSEHLAGSGIPTWNVTPRRFEQQLDGLLELGYHCRPLRQLVQLRRDSGTIPPRTVAITFDDGYQNVYTNAFPVLRARKLPATVFVASAFIGTRDPFPFDDWPGCFREDWAPAWLPLTWEQCREMEQSGWIEIGTHSHTHQDFRGRPEILKRDLLISVETINGALGEAQRAFAFPYGNKRLGFVDSSLIRAAQEAGVICALNSEIGLNERERSQLDWSRIEAVQDDRGPSLAAKLEGWYGWMDSVRAAFCFLAPFETAGVCPNRGVSQ